MNASPLPMPTVGAALRLAAKRLAASDNPRLEAEVLLAFVLGVGRTFLYAWPERVLSAAQAVQFEALLTRRATGEPVAYLTGEREFWGLNLHVTPATLIPRHDTEMLVEHALARLPADRAAWVFDLGTGSGAVALAIARERPACQVLALDASPAALAVARRNVRALGLDNVYLLAANWLDACTPRRAALIVANPPYLAPGDPHLAQGDVRFEPRAALVAAQNGLADLRRIIRAAPDYLQAGGGLLLEHGYEQAGPVAACLRQAGYTDIVCHPDLSGQARVSGGIFPG